MLYDKKHKTGMVTVIILGLVVSMGPSAWSAPTMPDSFFSTRLERGVASKAVSELAKHYRKSAEDGDWKALGKWLLVESNEKDREKVLKRVFGKKKLPFGFEWQTSFVLYEAYCRHLPTGEYVGKVQEDTLLSNEIAFLREVYVPEAVERSLMAAKAGGATETSLEKLTALGSEVNEFQHLSGKDLTACKIFLTSHPASPKAEVIREVGFPSLQRQYEASKSTSLANELVAFMPDSMSREFYAALWSDLQKAAAGKSAEEQLALLRPWLLVETYRMTPSGEAAFLCEILAWSGTLHTQLGAGDTAGLSFLTGRAVLNSFVAHMARQAIINAISNLDYKNMEKNLNESRQTALQITSNASAIRQTLEACAVVTLLADKLDVVINSALQDNTQEKVEEQIEEVFDVNEFSFASANEYQKACLNLLLKTFDVDANPWASLTALNLFPYHQALQPVLQMLRVYDYEEDMETFVRHFPEQSKALAEQWLLEPPAKQARALFALGILQEQSPGADQLTREMLGEDARFLDYYRLRNNLGDSHESKANLVNAAVGGDKTALVLYTRVMGDDATPEELVTLMLTEIGKKDFEETKATHIYLPLLRTLPKERKAELVSAMFDAYDPEWIDIGYILHKDMVPEEVTSVYVAQVMAGGNPYEKGSLMAILTERNDLTHADIYKRYLRGEYYGEADKKRIERNIKNQLTKDIITTYNTQINWSAVNEATEGIEKTVRGVLIAKGAKAFDMLPLEEATDIAVTSFLTNDYLCLQGAQWLLESCKPGEFDCSRLPGTNKDAAGHVKAMLAFLRAYYSGASDFSEFVRLAEEVSGKSEWLGLSSIASQYSQSLPKKEQVQINPIAEETLDGLVKSIQHRFAAMPAKIPSVQ